MKKSKFALNFITLGASAATLVVPLTSCAPTGKVIITIACDQHGQGSGIKEVNVGTKFGDIEPELRKYVSPYFSELFELTDWAKDSKDGKRIDKNYVIDAGFTAVAIFTLKPDVDPERPIPDSEMVFDQSKGVRVLNGLKRPLSCYDGFTSICIPADVFYIADNAFESSADDELPASIKTIEFDDNVIEEIPLIIGKSAFANSAYVEKFVFPQRLKYVCDSGFAGCISAKTIDISQWDANDVTSKAFPFASEHVFDGWTNDSDECEIVYDEEKIGDDVLELYFKFTGAGLSDKWISVDLEEDTSHVGFKALKYTPVNGDPVYILTKVLRHSTGKVEIPNWVDVIGPNVLEGIRSEVDKLTVASGAKLKWICHNAFAYASNLWAVNLENASSLRSIGTAAFYMAGLRTAILLPTSLTTLGASAFDSTYIKTIDLSETNITQIPIAAFKSCYSLSEVTMSNKINEIDPECFYNCYQLKTIDLQNVKFIGDYAFKNDRNLALTLESNENLQYIGKQAFYNTGLINIGIGKNVWCIGDGAFSDNNDTLTGITVDSENQYYKVTEKALYSKNNVTLLAITSQTDTLDPATEIIGECALSFAQWNESTLDLSEFANLKELRKESFMNFNFNNTNTVKLVLPSSVESIGDNAFESSWIDDINLSDLVNLKYLGESLFSDSFVLTEVTIPQGVERIPARSFFHCIKLGRITIPNSVKEIDEKAFDPNTSIIETDVDVSSFTQVPNWTGMNVFGSIKRNKRFTLHVANAELIQGWHDLLVKLGIQFTDPSLFKITTDPMPTPSV